MPKQPTEAVAAKGTGQKAQTPAPPPTASSDPGPERPETSKSSPAEPSAPTYSAQETAVIEKLAGCPPADLPADLVSELVQAGRRLHASKAASAKALKDCRNAWRGIFDLVRNIAEGVPDTDDYKGRRAELVALTQATLTREFIEASHAKRNFDELARQVADAGKQKEA